MARTRTENISFRQWVCPRVFEADSLLTRHANPKDLASKDELESTQDCVLIESLFTVWIV